MYLRHQAYTLYYRHVCILVFLHVFAYSMLLRSMLKFKRLACGSEDVAEHNTPTMPSLIIPKILIVSPCGDISCPPLKIKLMLGTTARNHTKISRYSSKRKESVRSCTWLSVDGTFFFTTKGYPVITCDVRGKNFGCYLAIWAHLQRC